VDVDLDVVVDLDLDGNRKMNFRRLDVYRKSLQFVSLSAKLMNALPTGYASFVDQLRRASMSIPLNIAEGSGKTGVRDQRNFYAIARGSAMECSAIVDVCGELGFVGVDVCDRANALLDSIVRMLSKMCR
jgi:four helix bundle protein